MITWSKLTAACLTAASLYFLGSVFASEWSQIGRVTDVFSVTVFALLAIPVYVVTTISGALAWIAAFRSTGERLPLLAGLRVHLVSQVGKYVPGNVGHFVGRLGLLKLSDRSVANGSVSILLELLWMIGAAATLAVYALLTGALRGVEQTYGLLEGLPFLVLLLALVVPNAGIALFNRLPSNIRGKLGFTGTVRRPPERVVLTCYGLYFINFLLNGLILIAGFYWLFGLSTAAPALAVSLYAVAWLLGFILPGAPGGIGVREALFLLLLGGLYGEGAAAAMAVIMRLISIAGDLFAFGIGSLLTYAKRAN